jgi:hypothetical protein
MQINLLKKTILMTIISTSLAGCGNDGGLDNNFKSDYPVEYSDEPIVLSLDEMSGVISFDLLQDATINGTSASSTESTIFARNFLFTSLNEKFVTPQVVVNLPSQPASPFTVSSEDNIMHIDTDAFAESLRMCDSTDNRGATNENGDPIGDGIRDFPQSITYDITYVLDNGYELEPGTVLPTRTLRMTINAISDPVTSVQAFNIDVAKGDNKAMLSATLPSYACNSDLTYAVASDTIASVDDSGNITGNNEGETTITVTSVENPELNATAKINVTSGFNLAITNQDFNALGAPEGTKSVPTCSAIGIAVEPTIVGDELTGSYHYNWSANNAVFANEESDGAFGAIGRFDNALAAGESATVTVGFGSGYSGATNGADIQEKMVTVTAERNYVCEPGDIPNGPVDLLLNAGGWGANATHVPGGLDGTALQITSNSDGAQFGNTTRQVWNLENNFHAATFGLGDASVGRTFKFAVWAKLGQLPADDADELKLEHTILPWLCTGCEDLSGFPGRYEAGVTGSVTATLKHTTDWQLVEFINPLTGTSEWSVPSNWNVPTAAFQFWDIYGFANGDNIMLDNYSIVEVK